jgi:site-specific DNA-methyltransferase (adenine-specific)
MIMPISEVYNIDCMEFMATCKDKQFDLAIVDPPYGLNIAKTGSIGCDNFTPKEWDCSIPDDDYFKELQRVSINQIIWGGNYFPYLWVNGCKDYIVWNKLNHHDNRVDVEMAWTSFNGLAKYVEYMWDGNRYGTKNNIKGVGMPSIRIHPTEKPIYLYNWLLNNYAKEGDKILDTHLGSGSSRIACYDGGFDFWGCELDKEYFDASAKRFENHKAQSTTKSILRE